MSDLSQSALPGFLIALAVLFAGLVLAFTLGRYPVSLKDIVDVLASRLSGRTSSAPLAVQSVVLLVRGPRVLAAVLVGAALAVSGTAFQGLFRNPLVSPDILGASSGAALGAVIAIYFSLGVAGIETLAFAGGLAAVGAVYAIGSAVQARDPVLLLVLTGVVIGALLGSGVGLIKYLADPYNQLPAMTFWLLGSLAATNVGDLLPLLGPVAIGMLVLLALRWRMNVMSLPEGRKRARLACRQARYAVPLSPPPRWSPRRASPRRASSVGSASSSRISRGRWSGQISRAFSPPPPSLAADSFSSSTRWPALQRWWKFRSGS